MNLELREFKIISIAFDCNVCYSEKENNSDVHFPRLIIYFITKLSLFNLRSFVSRRQTFPNTKVTIAVKIRNDTSTDTSTGDEDTEDELEYTGESRATTLPRGMQSAITAATNSLPRLPASPAPAGLTTTSTTPSSTMHKAYSVYHFLPQHSGVKSARYRPPGFARNSNVAGAIGGPKRAVSAPGLQVSGSQSSAGKRDNSRSRRQQAMSLTPGKSLFFSTFVIHRPIKQILDRWMRSRAGMSKTAARHTFSCGPSKILRFDF